MSDVDNELEELDRQRAQHEQGREDCSRRLQRLRRVGLGRRRACAGAVRARGWESVLKVQCTLFPCLPILQALESHGALLPSL